MAKELSVEEQAQQAEKDRVAFVKKQAEADRADELARRAARAKLAGNQPNLVVHGPAK